MFRTRAEQVSGWEAALPAELLRLPEDLARVDALLDDPVFFAPFAPFFDPRMGRPSTPMETYLRLMFLKFRYRLGYESLCREVADSISWRRFCRIRLDGQVPHPTTLMKLTTRCGPTAVDACNEALLAKAAEAKLLRTARLRADTTVVPANVAYPTDSGLLAKSVRRIAGTGRRIQAAGGAIRTRCRDRSRAAGSRAHAIAAKLRLRGAAGRDEAQATVRRITAELAELAERAAADAERLLTNARRALRAARRHAGDRATRGESSPAVGRRVPSARGARRGAGGPAGARAPGGEASRAGGRRGGGLQRAVDALAELRPAPRTIAPQTRQRLAGITPDGATRRVSLHDPAARPIAKGRLDRPVEFGYKGQVLDNTDGVVLDHTLDQGNPPDAPQLAPAVARVIARTGRRPRAVAADRGYGEARVENDLRDLGVRTVVIPRKGKPGKARQAAEHRPAFRKIVKWRTGCEGRISSLKRGYGWDRTRLDGLDGARIWTGQAVLAHNLVKIAVLAG